MGLATIPNAQVSQATSAATVHSAQGRDFSSYQHPVTSGDLQSLSFAYTRASDWSQYPNMHVDVNAQRNWAEMKSFGLHRGAYWYFYPQLDPVAQARFFFNTVKSFGLLNGDMLVCDMEELPNVDLNRATKTFMGELDSLCQASNIFAITMVYTNHNVGQHLTSCTKWPLWFAWPNSTAPPASLISPWKDWTVWQWGEVGGVDADAFNGTSTDMNAWVVNQSGPAPEGPYRHVADGTRSLYGICKNRHESMDEVIATTLGATEISTEHLDEFNSYIRRLMPSGMVYYTKTP